MRILVLQGGNSDEREVSLRSGSNMASALKMAGHEVSLADPSDKDFDIGQLTRDVDIVFPILHGAGGEDGFIQQLLEQIGIPFLGSNSKSARLTFDKVTYKEQLAEHGILTPNWQKVDRKSFEASGLSRSSYVLKPISGGSSIDTFIVHNPRHQAIDPKRLDEVFRKYTHMLLEELIEGQEVTIGLLGGKPLPVILIIPPLGQEFDYENKYNGKTLEITAPHQISDVLQKMAQDIASDIEKLMGCRHMTRTDMIIAGDGAIYTLETNTIPGLTEQSLLPKAAAADGLTMAELANRLVELVLAGS